MNTTLLQVLGVALVIILIVNMTLMALGVYGPLTFWIILVIFGVLGLFLVKRVKTSNEKKVKPSGKKKAQ